MSQPPETEAIRSYRAFWLHYLNEHGKPATRVLHIAGTVCALVLLLAAILETNPWLAGLAVAAGYGPAWVSHFFVEKNHPATLRYPLWSLISDLRMTAIWLAGGLETELEKARIDTSRSPPG